MQITGYQRVLAAIDFSAASADVIRQAAWMAERSYCSLTLMHVSERAIGSIRQVGYALRPGYFVGDRVKLAHQLQHQAEKRLEAMAVDLRRRGLNVGTFVTAGHPGEEIIAAAERESMDLVVVGRRGISPWKYHFLGSTARQLLHQSPCAVWSVRSPSQRWLKSVLTPVDFSPESGTALEQAAWLAKESNCRLYALHVVETQTWGDRLKAWARREPKTRLPDSKLEAIAWDHLAYFVKEHVSRFREVKTRVSFGNLVQETKRAAKQLGVGVVVIGAAARGRGDRPGKCDAAESILDACRCSIFVVRTKGRTSLGGIANCADAAASDETLLTQDLERYSTGWRPMRTIR